MRNDEVFHPDSIYCLPKSGEIGVKENETIDIKVAQKVLKDQKMEILHKLFGALDKWKREVEDIVQPDLIAQDVFIKTISPKFSDALVTYYKIHVANQIVADLKKIIKEVL